MNEGNITVVDVIATDDGYQLSRPAQDLYIAYEVVRRHIDSDGVRHYAQMSSARITDDGYEFKFETGDVFTCASHEDRPASATVSDAIAGGGSGGGNIEVVHVTFTDADGSYVVECDKTLADIVALIGAGKTVIAYCKDVNYDYFGTPTFVWPYYGLDGASIKAVGGATDISLGSSGIQEYTFYMDAESSSVDIRLWQKPQ